ncbi:MAG: glycerophosphodiester phosphodiesterase family protein [Alphaproteobacteria bacterium]
MDMTRRAATGLIIAGAALAPSFSSAQTARPLVIGHRGASGMRPEHTMMSYREAIAEGADVIEPDLVVTKDHILVARHENDITVTTDVSTRPEFASRARPAGRSGAPAWHVEDFTLREYQTLRAVERIPAQRPENAKYNGREAPPTLQQVIDLAKSESARLKRPIGIYPELKQWAELKAKGFETDKLLLDMLAKNHLPSANVPVFLQSFEPDALKAVKGKTAATIVQTTSDRALLTPDGLKQVAEYATGLGPDYSLVTPQLVENAHKLGIKVHPYTFRAENSYLPAAYKIGTDPNAHGNLVAYIRTYLDMGIDGFFTDFPALGVQARTR